jgi:hypothetical protein
MKTKSLLLLPLLMGALVLTGCSTVNSRINEKGPLFYSLDADTRAKISHGDVGMGFTPDMVYMALGNPDAKRHRTTADGTSETWIYGTYYDRYDGGAYLGYRRWGGWRGGFYRMYWEPIYAPFSRPVLSDDIRVTFRNGKVERIDQART